MSDKSISHTDMLENLIKKGYNHLDRKADNDKIAMKIGEFIKMMELHRKLAPANTDTKEFWEMVEQIRRDKLPAGSGATRPKKLSKSKTGRRRK